MTEIYRDNDGWIIDKSMSDDGKEVIYTITCGKPGTEIAKAVNEWLIMFADQIHEVTP